MSNYSQDGCSPQKTNLTLH